MEMRRHRERKSKHVRLGASGILNEIARWDIGAQEPDLPTRRLEGECDDLRTELMVVSFNASHHNQPICGMKPTTDKFGGNDPAGDRCCRVFLSRRRLSELPLLTDPVHGRLQDMQGRLSEWVSR